MRRIRWAVLASVLTVAASSAHASDLTGSWLGSQKCTYTNGDKPYKFEATITMRFSQAAYDLNVSSEGGLFQVIYNGFPRQDPKHPKLFKPTLIWCDNDASQSIIGVFKASTRDDGGGKMSGVVSAMSAPFTYSCKYRLERISTADPGISGTGCP